MFLFNTFPIFVFAAGEIEDYRNINTGYNKPTVAFTIQVYSSDGYLKGSVSSSSSNNIFSDNDPSVPTITATVGDKLRFINNSISNEEGFYIDLLDFQYYSAQENYINKISPSVFSNIQITLTKPCTWMFYLCARDNAPPKAQYRNHENWSDNGNHSSVGYGPNAPNGIYWYFTKIRVVVESNQPTEGKVISMFVGRDFDGTEKEISPRQETVVSIPYDETVQQTVSYKTISGYDYNGNDISWKSPNNFQDYSTGTTRSVTLDKNKNTVYVRFLYTQKPLGEPSLGISASPTKVEPGVSYKVIDFSKPSQSGTKIVKWVVKEEFYPRVGGPVQVIQPEKTITDASQFFKSYTKTAEGIYKYTVSSVTDDVGLTKTGSVSALVTVERQREGPIVSISGPRYVQAGELVTYYGIATPKEPDATIVSYLWGSEPNSFVEGQTTKDVMGFFAQIGEYLLALEATDSNGLSGYAMYQVNVSAPYPSAIIKFNGTLKENRKISVDGTSSIGNVLYPINWNMSYWTIESVNGSNLEDILFNVPMSNIKYENNSVKVYGLPKFDIQVSKACMFKFTLYVENTYGNSSTTYQILEVSEDLPPIVDFSVVSTTLRNPENNYKATLKITDNTRSPDDDIISKRKIDIYYNSNNGQISGFNNYIGDNTFNASWQKITTIESVDITKKDFTYDVSDVGTYKIEITAEEVPGQPVFSNGTYRKVNNGQIIDYSYSGTTAKLGNSSGKDINEKVIEVRNIAPVAEVSASKTDKMAKMDVVINAMGSGLNLDMLESAANNILGAAYAGEDIDYKIDVLRDERVKVQPDVFCTNSYVFVRDYLGNIFCSSDYDFVSLYDKKTGSYEKEDLLKSSLKDVKDIKISSSSHSSYHALVLDNSGNVYSFGNNGNGQLGTGDRTNLTINNKYHISGINGVQIAVGDYYSVILSANGDVYTFGRNNYGQIGDGTNNDRFTPYKVLGLPRIKKISTNTGTILTLGVDGTVWAWGNNSYGQLGDGTSVNSSTPKKIEGLNNIVDISIGLFHCLALDIDGNVFGWGDNRYFQLTNKLPATDKRTPAIIENLPFTVKNIYATGYNSYFLAYDSNVYMVGMTTKKYQNGNYINQYNGEPWIEFSDVVAFDVYNTSSTSSGVYVDRGMKVYRFTRDSSYYSLTKTEPKIFNGIKDIFITPYQGFAINDEGNLISWGIEWNGVDSLGLGAYSSPDNNYAFRNKDYVQAPHGYKYKISPSDRRFRDVVSFATTKIYANSSYSFRFLVDKHGDVYYSRYDNKGFRLADKIKNMSKVFEADRKFYFVGKNGNLYYLSDMVNMTLTKINGVSNVSNVVYCPDPGFDILVLDNSGRVYRVSETNASSPVLVIENVTSLASNAQAAIVSTTSGQVYTWGRNINKCLGIGQDNTNHYQCTPALVPGLSNIKSVSCNNFPSSMETSYPTMFAITEDGEVYTWGYMEYEKLGMPKGENSPSYTTLGVPTKLSGYTNIEKIYKDSRVIVAITKDNVVIGSGISDSNTLNNTYFLFGVSNTYRGSVMSGFLRFNPADYVLNTSNILNNISWREGSQRFYVDFNNNFSYVNAGSYNYQNVVVGMLNSKAKFVGINNSANKEIITQLIKDINGYGKYIEFSSIYSNLEKLKLYTLNRKPVDLYINIGVTEHDNIQLIEQKINELVKPMLESYNIEPNIRIEDGERIPENRFYYKGTDDYIYEYDPLTGENNKVSHCTVAYAFLADDGYLYYSGSGTNNVGIFRYNSETKNVEVVLTSLDPILIGYIFDNPQYVYPSFGTDFAVHEGKLHISRKYTYAGYYYVDYITYDLITKEIQVKRSTSYSSSPPDGAIYDFDSYFVNHKGYVNYIERRMGAGAPTLGGSGFLGTVQYWFTNNMMYLSPETGYIYYPGTYVISGLFRDSNIFKSGYPNGGVFGKGNKIFISLERAEHIGMYDPGIYVYDEFTDTFTRITEGNGYTLQALTPDGKLWYSYNNILYTYDILTGAHKEELAVQVKTPVRYHPYVPSRRLRKLGIEESIDKNSWRNEGSRYYVYLDDEEKETDGLSYHGNSLVYSPVMLNIDLSDVKYIKSANDFNIVLKNDGTVWAWGNNNYSQLCDGTTKNSIVPKQIDITDVKDIFTNGLSVFALKNDGTLWAWGYNSSGQLGIGNTSSYRNTPTAVNISDVKEIYFAPNNSSYVIALTNNGSVWAWGNNEYGQLGIGSTANRNVPTQVNITDVKNIYVYQGTVYALKNDGTLWAWGYNNYGQVGDGTTTNRTSPVQINIGNVKEVYAYNNYVIALKNDGSVWAWGANGSGQLGIGTTANKYVPTQVSITDVKNIYIVSATVYALKNDGTLWAWGSNGYGQVGDGTTINRTSPVQVDIDNIKKILINTGDFIIVLKNDGTVWGWGYNYFGMLGDGTTVNKNRPTQIQISDIKDIYMGYYFVAALKQDRTFWAWGHNGYGQIGDGTTINKLVPTFITSNVEDAIINKGSVILIKKFIYNSVNELNDTSASDRIKNKLTDSNMNFVGMGTDQNKEKMEAFLQDIGFSTFIDNSNIDNALLELALHVINTAGLSKKGVELYVLLNEIVEFLTKYEDAENDPMYRERWFISHYPEYFENSLGLFEYSGLYLQEIPKSFNKTGKYLITYQVRDNPKDDDNFDHYRLWSNPDIAKITLYVHRKPIAKFLYELTYTPAKDKLNITFTNLSYDLDHESEHDRGIVEEEWFYKMKDGLYWIKGKPSQLLLGTTYMIQLYVKDKEGVWSDPYIEYIITGEVDFPPSVDASPTSMTIRSNTASITVTVTADDKGENDFKEVRYKWSNSTEKPVDGWSISTDMVFTTSLSSFGTYFLHMEVFDLAGNSFYRYRGPYTKLYDNIPTVDAIPTSATSSAPIIVTIIADDKGDNDFKEVRYKWATSTEKPTSGWNISGVKEFTTALSTEGTYYLHMEVFDQAGNSFYRYRGPYTIETLEITGVTIEGYWNHWRGQVNLFGKRMSVEPHRFLSLERVKINIYTTGYAEKVEIRFSPELEAMQFIDKFGNKYDYKDDFKMEYVYFPVTITLDSTKKDNHVYWEYALPLANSTKSWEDERLREPYFMEVTVWKGTKSVKYTIPDIEITGNIFDLTYIQPIN